MPVAEGRNGKVTVIYLTDTGAHAGTEHTIAEMGSWSISGISRNMIDYTAFGDTVMKFKPGMLDPGTISFSGFYDGTDTTGQVKLITMMSSGSAIGVSNTKCSTGATKLSRLRLWANDDTSFDSPGFWSCTGSTGEIYITGMELGQDKNGLGTVTFNGKVSKGALGWKANST